jgi:hypothetical protein
MMSYPPDHSQSGHLQSKQFEQLTRIRRTLLMLLSREKEARPKEPDLSLFCSRRNYRKDEIRAGLKRGAGYGFSDN